MLTCGRDILAIPSFKWYSGGSMKIPRMSMSCEFYGNRLLGIGGRLAWDSGELAGCYSTPAMAWDVERQAAVTTISVSSNMPKTFA